MAGRVQPSAHNLSKISQLVAETVPGFTMLDWDREYDDFARVIDAKIAPSQTGFDTLLPLLPKKLAAEAQHAAAQRSQAYEGIWRTTRPSSDLPGEFLHDVSIVRRDSDGFLKFSSGVEGFFYEGSTILIGQQLYYFAADDAFGAVTMGILNGVPRQRAEVIDGVLLTTLRDAGASPTASSIIMHRVHDLTDDPSADEERFKELVNNQRLVAEPGSVPQEIVDHLHGAANAPGMLRMLFAQSMSRGPRLTGDS